MKRTNPIIPIAAIIDIIDTIVILLVGLVTKGFRFWLPINRVNCFDVALWGARKFVKILVTVVTDLLSV